MDVKHQIFVSSTYRDLIDERRAVMQAILELDCIPAGMELFPASDDDSWTLIKRVIDASDYYLVVIGDRYGSMTEEGIGYTEAEYDYAVETGKPVVAFIREPVAVTSRAEESGEITAKLEKFKIKTRKKAVKTWTNSENLAAAVVVSLTHLRKTRPTEGWVRPSQVTRNDLLERIDQYRSELESLKSKFGAMDSVGEKVHEYADGDDEIRVEYDDFGREGGQVSSTTVNKIIQSLGLSGVEWISQSVMEERLQRLVPGTMTKASRDKCLIQLLALGLLEYNVGRVFTSWRLTPSGTRRLVDLVAVTRGEGQGTA